MQRASIFPRLSFFPFADGSTPLRSFAFTCALFFSVAVSCLLYAQEEEPGQLDECSGGTLYYLAFPDTTMNAWDSRFPAQLLRPRPPVTAFSFYIYSPVDQQIKIEPVNNMSDTIEALDLKAGEIYEYNATKVPLVTVANSPQTNVLRFESESPVLIYGYMLTAFGCAAYAAIPVEHWGTEYYAVTWPGEVVRDIFPNSEFNYRPVRKEGPAEILIIAAYDSTRVTISPTAELKDCETCREVVLNAGEAYQVQSVVDTSATALAQGDLSGTFIQASRPIGVMSGNTRVMHNAGERPALGENAFKDMTLEWLSPVEAHGKRFVFMPTWDSERQRPEIDPDGQRSAELVRFYATAAVDEEEEGTHVFRHDHGEGGSITGSPIRRGQFHEETRTTAEARAYTSSKPVFAVMTPKAVVKFNGTTTWGQNYIGASYLAWSSYMAELVPREQWPSFAPFRVPSLPRDMKHYLNLAVDSAHQSDVYIRLQGGAATPFVFNQGSIPGTDFVWGTMPVESKLSYFIQGEDGARFYGVVYGSYRGQEQYRPGGTRKDDKEAAPTAGKEGLSEALHPSEYEEDVALMYGFPLAPRRCQTDFSGVGNDASVTGFQIESAAPNPFTRETRIDFTLGTGGRTIVEIYNSDGERVETLADAQMSAGKHDVFWNAEGIAAGLYHIRIRSGAWSGTRQVVLTR